MDVIFEIPELSCKHLFWQFWNIVLTHAEYTFFLKDMCKKKVDKALIVNLQDDYIYLRRKLVNVLRSKFNVFSSFICEILKPNGLMLPGEEGGGGESPLVKNKICKSIDLVDPMQVRINGTLV